MLEMWFSVQESLKMLVSALMPFCPRCLRCRYDMLSGPVDVEFFSLRMTLEVSSGEKGIVASVSIMVASLRPVVHLLSLCVGLKLICA